MRLSSTNILYHHASHSGVQKQREDVGVTFTFAKRLFKLLRVIVPSVFSAEAGYLVVVAAAMVARTFCDLWMLKNGTSIENMIIMRDAQGFKKHITMFFMAMLPMSVINNILKYGLNELKLRFRNRLTAYLTNKYLYSFTYYKVGLGF